MTHSLTVGINEYDHVRPLRTGDVDVPGAELRFETEVPPVLFPKVVEHQRYDVAEMSLCTFTNWVDEGDCPYVGIPAFPSRRFRHRSVFVDEDSDVTGPADLDGGRIGIRGEYQITAATTARGILADQYGFDPGSVTWYTTRPESVPIDPPVEYVLAADERSAARARIERMLAAGDLDAIINPATPDALGDGIERLFPEYPEVEADYYGETGVFPIMHLLVLHRRIYDDHPELATRLYESFSRAKAMAAADLEASGDASGHDLLPWPDYGFGRTREIMGEDHWPYGFAANRDAVATLTRYAHEQGITGARVSPRELFVDELCST